MQNYVGRTRLDYSEEVLCPRAEDLPERMDDWMTMVHKIYNSTPSS